MTELSTGLDSNAQRFKATAQAKKCDILVPPLKGVGAAAPLGSAATGATAPVTIVLQTMATMPAAAGMTTTTATIAQETVTA